MARHASSPWAANLAAGSGAAWRLDEARLVRRRRRHGNGGGGGADAELAANMALALVAQIDGAVAARVAGAAAVAVTTPGGGGGGGGEGVSLQLATALSLAGAWCAEAQIDCSAHGGVMGLMGRAADIAVLALGREGTGSGAAGGQQEMDGAAATAWESQAACKVRLCHDLCGRGVLLRGYAARRPLQVADSSTFTPQVLYRLASYADQRYREVLAVRQSPEHVRRMAAAAAKKREAATLQERKSEEGILLCIVASHAMADGTVGGREG